MTWISLPPRTEDLDRINWTRLDQRPQVCCTTTLFVAIESAADCRQHHRMIEYAYAKDYES